MARGNVDDEVRDLAEGNGLEMVADNVNVPAIYEWAGWFDEGPGFLHTLFEGEVGDG